MNINKKWAPGSKCCKEIDILKEDARTFIHQALISSFALEIFAQTCLCIMTQEQRIFTRLLFHPSSHPFHFFEQTSVFLQKETATQDWGAWLSLLLFLQAFSTWAELQVQLVCVITSGSCSSELSSGWDDRLQRQKTATPTPPLLAFNTPAWLTPADQHWGNASLVPLTSFMHLSLPHSTQCEAEVH